MRFVHHLHFFRGVALVLGRADLRNEIERDRVGKRFVLMLFVFERGLAAVDQVALAADAGAAGGLVGADDDAADAAGIVAAASWRRPFASSSSSGWR